MIATDGKQLVIVTFRPKEKRKDQSDKVQIARKMISGDEPHPRHQSLRCPDLELPCHGAGDRTAAQ